MKAARATVAAISHGLDFGFHCPLFATLSDIRLLSRRGQVLLHLQIQDVSQHLPDSSYIRYVFEIDLYAYNKPTPFREASG